MNEGITRDTLAILAAPFAARDHEFNRGFIYITEEAICARIEQVDPSWEWRVSSVTFENDMATVVGALKICGITRYGTGQQLAQIDKNGKENVGESRKGATTDAMKRAARLFGIGRYLLQCPKTIKDYGRELDTWLVSVAKGVSSITPTPQAAQPVMPTASDPKPDMLRFTDTERFANFVQWAKDHHDMTRDDVLTALYEIDGTSFKEAPAKRAMKAVVDWVGKNKRQAS